MPTPRNPGPDLFAPATAGKKADAPLAERMELCRNLAGDSRIIVTGFEEDLSTPYTAVTLAFLKQHSRCLLRIGGSLDNGKRLTVRGNILTVTGNHSHR